MGVFAVTRRLYRLPSTGRQPGPSRSTSMREPPWACISTRTCSRVSDGASGSKPGNMFCASVYSWFAHSRPRRSASWYGSGMNAR
jgi:hypothetical protein